MGGRHSNYFTSATSGFLPPLSSTARLASTSPSSRMPLLINSWASIQCGLNQFGELAIATRRQCSVRAKSFCRACSVAYSTSSAVPLSGNSPTRLESIGKIGGFTGRCTLLMPYRGGRVHQPCKDLVYTSTQKWRSNGTQPRQERTFANMALAFADAVTALEDERAISVRDEREDEERWITIGMDSLARILVVVYTWRKEQIRLISARLATRTESRQYEEGYEEGI